MSFFTLVFIFIYTVLIFVDTIFFLVIVQVCVCGGAGEDVSLILSM